MMKKLSSIRLSSTPVPDSSRHPGAAGGQSRLKNLWAEKHKVAEGLGKDQNGAGAAAQSRPRADEGQDGNVGGRIWSDEETKAMLAAFLEWCPQPAAELRRIDLKVIAFALGGGQPVPLDHAAEFVMTLCRYLIRAVSAAGDSNVIRTLCDDFGVIGSNCHTIIVMILSLEGNEGLKAVCSSGLPSAFVRLIARMHSMVILVESERQKEAVDLRQIHLVLWYIVSRVLRHVSRSPDVVDDLIRGEGIGRLMQLAAQAAKGLGGDNTALFAASSVSKWIELHAIDILIFLFDSGMSPQLAQHMVRYSALECVGDALEEALHSPGAEAEEPHLHGVLALFKLLLRVAECASESRSLDLMDHAKSCHPLLLLKSLILHLCSELYKDSWQAKGMLEDGAMTPSGETTPHFKSAETVWEVIREVRRRKSFRLMHLLDNEVQRETAYRMLRAKSWDIDEAVEAYYRAERDGMRGAEKGKQRARGGLGIKLGVDNGVFFVLSMAPGGPAMTSGQVHEHDEIAAVGEEPITSTMSMRDVATLMRGTVGEEVAVTFRVRTTATGGEFHVVKMRWAADATNRRASAAGAEVSLVEATRAATQELIDRLNGDIPEELAEKLVVRSGGDVDRAELMLQQLPKTRILHDLLLVAKEFSFVGEAPLEVDQHNTEALAWAQGPDGKDKLSRNVVWDRMSRVPGRRVRDAQAFLVLCELWHRVFDDSFREEILDLALEVFTEHPLNFFALQSSGFLSAVLESQDALSPPLRERTMKVLEYVITCADCVPERDLVLFTRCLDVVWEEETVDTALRTVVKWLSFDAKYGMVFRETGLVQVLVRHMARFSAAAQPDAVSRGVLHERSAGGGDDGAWLTFDQGAFERVEGLGLRAKVSKTPCFGLALGAKELVGGNWTWEVTISKGEGDANLALYGLGVASKEAEKSEALTVGKSAGGKGIKGWFYHSLGMVGSGEMLEHERVFPFWFGPDGRIVLSVVLNGKKGELSFTCNGEEVAGRINGVVGKGLHPAIYVGGSGITFHMSQPSECDAPGQVEGGEPAVPGPQMVGMAELQRKCVREALKVEGVIGDGGDEDLSYAALFSSVERVVDYSNVRGELSGISNDEKRVICDRIWAAAGRASNQSSVPGRNIEYAWVPMSWTVSAEGLIDLVASAAHGHVGRVREGGSEGADEIGDVAAELLLSYAQAVSRLVATPLPPAASVLVAEGLGGGKSKSAGGRCLATTRNFGVLMDAVLLLVSFNPANMRVARACGLRTSALKLLRCAQYREAAVRLLQRMVGDDFLLLEGDLDAILDVFSASSPLQLAQRRVVIECVDKTRNANARVAAHLAQHGWLRASTDALGQLGVPYDRQGGGGTKEGAKLERVGSFAKRKIDSTGQNPWYLVGLAMAALRLLSQTKVSPQSPHSAVWDSIGWAALVRRADEGGLMRLGGGYTILGLLLDLAVSRPNNLEAMLASGDRVSKASQLDDSVEVAHFISRWGDHADAVGEHLIVCPDAVTVALVLLTLARKDLKIRGARAVLQLAKGCTHNRCALANSGAVAVVVECFRDVLTSTKSEHLALQRTLKDLVAAIGHYKLSIADSRSIGALGLSGGAKTGLPTALSLLREAALGKRRDGTVQFPFFEGFINSQHPATRACSFIIELPQFSLAWPPRAGVSVAMWLQFEATTTGSIGGAGPSAHVFYLAKIGRGGEAEATTHAMSASVERGVLRVTAPHCHIDARFPEAPLAYGKLYHIAIVYHRLLLNPDVVRLYIDGEEVGSAKAQTDSNALIQGMVGTMMPQPYRLDVGGSLPAESPAEAYDECMQRVGNCIVVDEPLPSNYILSHFLAAPAHEAQPTMDLSRVVPHVSARTLPIYGRLNGGDMTFALSPTPPRSGVLSEESVKLAISAASVVERLAAAGAPAPPVVAGNVKERGAGEIIRNCASQQSIAAMLYSDVDAPKAAKLSPKARAFNGSGPTTALVPAGGFGLALALLSQAESPEHLDECLDTLIALFEGSARSADQALRMGACRVICVLLQRKLEHVREATIHKAIRFSGIVVDDDSAVVSNPDALNDLIFSRGLWRRVPSQLQAKMYHMLSASLCNSSQHAYNAMRLSLVGGFSALLRAMSDESLPEDALAPLLAVVKLHLRKHMRPTDLSDVLMCILSSFPHAVQPARGGDPDDVEVGGRTPELSGNNGAWGKGPAAATRRVQVRNLLLSAILELVSPAESGGEESAHELIHKIFHTRQLVKMLQTPSLHSSSAVILMQLLLIHIAHKPKHAKKFVSIGGFAVLRTCLVPLSDCPYMLLFAIHLLFGAPVRDLPQGLDQEVLVVCIDAVASHKVEFPEALQVYMAMIEGLCARDGDASSEPARWEGICRLPSHGDPSTSLRTAKGDTVPHLVPEDEQRSLAATATELLALLFEICPSFQQCAREGEFNNYLLSLALSPPLCAPCTRSSTAPAASMNSPTAPTSMNSPAALQSPGDAQGGGFEEVSESEFEALQQEMEAKMGEQGDLAGGVANPAQSRFSLSAMPQGENDLAVKQAPGGRWSMPGFSVGAAKDETSKDVKVDTARVLPLGDFRDGAGLAKERADFGGGNVVVVAPDYIESLDGAMATRVLDLVLMGLVEGVRGHVKTSVVKKILLDGPGDAATQLHAVLQSKILLSLISWLLMEVTDASLENNTKLAKNLTELCDIAVQRTETGWLFMGEKRVLDFCLHCVKVLHQHWHLHKKVSSATWRLLSLLIGNLPPGPLLTHTLDTILKNRETALHAAGCEDKYVRHIFNHVAHMLIDKWYTHTESLQLAAELAGVMMGTAMQHTRGPILGMLVQKPSRSVTSLFMAKDKPIDLFNNGFDKLLATDAVVFMRKGRKAGEGYDQFKEWLTTADAEGFVANRVQETFGKVRKARRVSGVMNHVCGGAFKEWLTAADAEGFVANRVQETFGKVAKDQEEKMERLVQDEFRSEKARRDGQVVLANKQKSREANLEAKRRNKELVVETEVARYEALGRVLFRRAIHKAKVAQLTWLRVKRSMQEEVRIMNKGPGEDSLPRWTLDVWVDSRHTRRRLVRMSAAYKPMHLAESPYITTVAEESAQPDVQALAAILPPVSRRAFEDELDDEETGGRSRLRSSFDADNLNGNNRTLSPPNSVGSPPPGGAHTAPLGTPRLPGSGGEDEEIKVVTEGVAEAEHKEEHATAAQKKGFLSFPSLFGKGKNKHQAHSPAKVQGASPSPQTPGDSSKSPGSEWDAVGEASPQAGHGSAMSPATPAVGESINDSGAHLPGVLEEGEEEDVEGQQVMDEMGMGSGRRFSVEEEVESDDEEAEGAVSEGVMATWQQAISTLDGDWRLAAFLETGESAIRAVRASRVTGLERIDGTLVLCQKALKAGSQGERPTSMYLIADEAVASLGEDDGIDDIKLETQHATANATAQIPFGHLNEVSPGVLRWRSEEVRLVAPRLWQLQPLAFEIFTKGGGSTLIVFSDIETRSSVESLLLSGGVLEGVVTGNGWPVDTETNKKQKREVLHKAWAVGQMSNLDYLLELNALAGRTVNDLTQYPVMPWVIADYESEELDLNKPSTFRNLSKPMGSLDPASEEAARERFADWDEESSGGTPAFHYGSHYSTSAHVLHYLVRLEPYTSYHCTLQGGRLDISDRLFHSLAESYGSSAGSSNLSDVKELVPEFYYNPHFLTNVNSLDLGTRQDGIKVDDVVLPPWAKGDPREFVRQARAALESDYVSDHLHEWIDLIFGYKQRGKYAEEACNVFYYLTYENAIDISVLEAGVARDAVLAQITNFGQTPRQLFRRHHPQRSQQPRPNVMTHPEFLTQTAVVDVGSSVWDVLVIPDRFVAYTSHACPLPPSGEICIVPHLGRPGSAAVLQRDTHKRLAILESLHDTVITAMASSKGGTTLATGGADGVVRLWDIQENAWWNFPMKPVAPTVPALVAHSDRVTCLAVSQGHGVCLSGGLDGLAVVWDIRRAAAHHLLAGDKDAVVSVAIDEETGSFVVCTSSCIRVWSNNGEALACLRRGDARGFEAHVTKCALRNGTVWSADDLVVTGHTDGTVRLWGLRASEGSSEPVQRLGRPDGPLPYSLFCRWTLQAGNSEVTALSISNLGRELGAGDSSGRAVLWRPNPDAAPVAAELNTLMDQSLYIEAFGDGLAGHARQDGDEGDTEFERGWLSQTLALRLICEAGDGSKVFHERWSTCCAPAEQASEDGMAAEPLLTPDGQLKGIYNVVYRHYMRKAIVDLQDRLDKRGAGLVASFDDFVKGFSGTWVQFWQSAEGVMEAKVKGLRAGWLQDNVQNLGKTLANSSP